MAGDEPRYTFDRVARMTISAAVLVGVFALLRYLSDVLIPFAAAVVLAYLLNPLVTLVEQKTGRRNLAVAMTIGGLGVLCAAIMALLVPLVIGQVGRFQNDIQRLRDDLSKSFEVSPLTAATTEPTETPPGGDSKGKEAKSATGLAELRNAWSRYRTDAGTVARSQRLANLREEVSGTYVGDVITRVVQFVQSPDFNELLLSMAKRLAIGGWTVLSFVISVVLALTGLIIVLLYLVFLLMDYPEYARTWPTFLPAVYREPAVEFLEQFDTALRRYFRGQSVVALLTGALFALGFTIIGLPMAIPFGLFVGLLNMVPYLQMVALVPGVLLAALRAIEGDAGFAMSLLLVLIVFTVIQIIQDALITPRIMGKATGLRPIAILLGIFVWGKLLGFLGLMLAIPLTCLGIAYYRRFVLSHASSMTVTDANST